MSSRHPVLTTLKTHGPLPLRAIVARSGCGYCAVAMALYHYSRLGDVQQLPEPIRTGRKGRPSHLWRFVAEEV